MLTAHAQTKRYRVQAALVGVIVIVFLVFFQVTKHNALLDSLVPFGDDPYDAVGSFATLFACFAATLSIIRVSRLNKKGESDSHGLKVIQAQLTAVVAVTITAFTDTVEAFRYVHLWWGMQAGVVLMLVLAMLFLSSVLATQIIASSSSTKPQTSLLKPIALAILCGALVAAYPHSFLDSTAGHLSAILLGAMVLFVLIRVFTLALVPAEANQENPKYWWPQVAIGGLLLGLAIAGLENATEGRLVPVADFLFVLGGWGAVCIAYVFLAKPLGLYSLRPR